MPVLIQNRDLRTLYRGAAIAVAAGLLMGAAMQPNLDEGRLEGPQILLAGGGLRAEPAAYDPGAAAYGPRLPEYVIGTDYTRPAVEDAMPQYDEHAETAEEAAAEDAYAAPVLVYRGVDRVQAVAASQWDEPRPAPLYPSEQGNTYYSSDLPGPPEPPAEGETDPADA